MASLRSFDALEQAEAALGPVPVVLELKLARKFAPGQMSAPESLKKRELIM